MAGIFTFPVRDLPKPQYTTLVCFATHQFHEDDLLDEVRKYCDRHSPPDEVVLLGPSFVSNVFDNVTSSTRFQSRLPGASRHVGTPCVETLCFDAAGPQNIGRPEIGRILRTGLMTLFQEHRGLIRSSSAVHYVKPSGRHCDAFLRTANVLVRGIEIEFIASCCLSTCPAEMSRVYTDTGAIHSVAFALLRLLSAFADPRSDSIVDSFGSYSRLKDFSFLDASRALVLISASTSGRLTEDIISQEPGIRREHVTTIYYLGEEPTSVLCDLKFDPIKNPDGFDLVQSYPPESCPFCVGSTAVQMSEEQFIPQGPQVEQLLIRAKDAPYATSDFFRPLVGRGVFRANYRENESSFTSQDIYLDLIPLFSTDLFREIEEFPGAFDRFASHIVSANTKRIIHLDDKASKHLAGRIAIFADGCGVTVNILSAKEVQNVGQHVQEGGTTIVVASALTTGRSLTEVSKSLRHAQKGGAIKYAVAFSRPNGPDMSLDVQRHLSFGNNGPREHTVAIMYEYCFPSWRPEGKTAWQAEFDLLDDTFDPPPTELQDRHETLRASASSEVRGLQDNLFLPSRDGKQLKLRPSFAFWKFDYSERSPTQADVFATVVAVLHNLRNAKKGTQHSLRQDEHVRKVLSPRCFERFNDGVIQACMLRAAHSTELDYSVQETLSEDMRNIVSTILDQSNESVGEAADEFLLALAIGRLRLCTSHTAALRDEFGEHSQDDATSKFLWKKIRARCELQ